MSTKLGELQGVSEIIIDKMFNQFYTTKEIGKGTGIGLSVSKSMIEKNGGKLYYDHTSMNTKFVVKFLMKP